MKKIGLVVLFMGAILLVGCRHNPMVIEATRGEKAYKHLVYISEVIGQRGSHSLEEKETATYIEEQCEQMGYKVQHQKFESTFVGGDSENLVITKKGKTSREIVIGAHYDSVTSLNTPTLKGANDNAGSVGIILETMEALKNVETEYTITFIFFGAEEIGLEGSKYYVSQLSEEGILNIEVMINIDSVLGGDYLYIYGNADERGKYRDRIIEVAKDKGLEVRTQEGENRIYPRGTTINLSDHAAFDKVGVPIIFFGSGNWDIGDQSPYVETMINGLPAVILHTENDNLTFLDKTFPGRIEKSLYTYTNLLINTIIYSDYVLQVD